MLIPGEVVDSFQLLLQTIILGYGTLTWILLEDHVTEIVILTLKQY